MATYRDMYVGTVEFLDVQVTADVELNTQPVQISIDECVTWLDATWQGTAGTTRVASVLLGDTQALPDPGTYLVFVKVTDDPEIPLFLATGKLRVKTP